MFGDEENSGGHVFRSALQLMIDRDDTDFTIYNNSDYVPQLEISRFPEEMRQKVYEEKNYEVKESAKGTSSHTGEFLVESAIDFVSTNYCRFETPISTNITPKSRKKRNDMNTKKYKIQLSVYRP